ncbi:hypothetical protein KBTX_00799 [wastewater metagenome]|uniref:DUF4124 domain-containing protein n=2 Tax=unclassified sequences TaxID=12908 RepID=A0A5B8R7P0_9ZZZZ|nr:MULTISPECIES: DUF4124 domain-containing protein [Arhodomonas]MCS4505931.1 DUF4124 domain-containing protein [Arhodomonas aquaeolei]QEA04491.1 hypothetical protein KBTEX_00799 [uncultured organism]
MRWTAILLALALGVPAAASAAVYKWTDADGEVHYGSQPPQGRDAREVRVPGAGKGKGQPGDTAKEGSAAPSQTAGDDADRKPERGTPDPDWMRQQCQAARDNLEAFTNATPNQRFRRPDGEVVRYSAEEIESQRKEAQAFIDKNCSDIPAKGNDAAR